MTPNELRAAAEGVLTTATELGWDRRNDSKDYDTQACVLARYILATVKPDDNTPIDAEWILATGWMPASIDRRHHVVGISETVYSAFLSPNGCWGLLCTDGAWAAYQTTYSDGFDGRESYLVGVYVRSDVRRLAEALRIKLLEFDK